MGGNLLNGAHYDLPARFIENVWFLAHRGTHLPFQLRVRRQERRAVAIMLAIYRTRRTAMQPSAVGGERDEISKRRHVHLRPTIHPTSRKRKRRTILRHATNPSLTLPARLPVAYASGSLHARCNGQGRSATSCLLCERLRNFLE